MCFFEIIVMAVDKTIINRTFAMTLLNNLEQFISLNNYCQSDIPRGFAAQLTRLFADY